MKKLNYQIINAFEGENLVNNVVQTLPAYLEFSFIIDAHYQISLTSPDNKKAGELSGYSHLGSVNHWRIPLVTEGEWSIIIDYQGDLSSDQEVLSLQVPSRLFEVTCEDEEEEDYLHEISCSLPESFAGLPDRSQVSPDQHQPQILVAPPLLKNQISLHHQGSQCKQPLFFYLILLP